MYHLDPNSDRVETMTKEELLQERNAKEFILLIPVVAYVSVLMAAGLIGNGLVLYVYKFRFRKSSSRAFILCLAILDTLTCIIGIPYHVLDMYYPYKFTNVAACKCLSYAVSLSLVSSIFVLVLIAIDRYRKICTPFKKQLSSLGTKTVCSAAVLVSAIFVVPNIILYGQSSIEIQGTNVTGTECYIADEFEESLFALIYHGFLLLIFISCTLVLSVLYTLVGLRVWRQGTFIDDTGRRSSVFSRSVKLCGNTNGIPQTTEEILSDDERSKSSSKGRNSRRPSARSDENCKLHTNGNLEKSIDANKGGNKENTGSLLNKDELDINEKTDNDAKCSVDEPPHSDISKPNGNEMLDTVVPKSENQIQKAKEDQNIETEYRFNDSFAEKPVFTKRESRVEFCFNVSTGDEPVYKPTTCPLKDPYSTSSHSSPPPRRKHSTVVIQTKPKLMRLNTFSGSEEEADGNNFFYRRYMTNRKMSRLSVSRASISRKQQRSLRITCMLFLITVVFMISFLPHLIILLLDTLNPEFWSSAGDAENVLYNFLFRTYFINNMANPLIYGFLDERFRLEVKLLFRRLANCNCRAIFAK